MVQDFSEIGEFVRFHRAPENIFRYSNVQKSWRDTYHVDASVFTVSSHNIMDGSTGGIFQRPDEIAVSQRFSIEYFGSESALGRICVLQSE